MTPETVTIVVPSTPVTIVVVDPGATLGLPDGLVVDRAGAYVRTRSGDYVAPR